MSTPSALARHLRGPELPATLPIRRLPPRRPSPFCNGTVGRRASGARLNGFPDPAGAPSARLRRYLPVRTLKNLSGSLAEPLPVPLIQLTVFSYLTGWIQSRRRMRGRQISDFLDEAGGSCGRSFARSSRRWPKGGRNGVHFAWNARSRRRIVLPCFLRGWPCRGGAAYPLPMDRTAPDSMSRPMPAAGRALPPVPGPGPSTHSRPPPPPRSVPSP